MKLDKTAMNIYKGFHDLLLNAAECILSKRRQFAGLVSEKMQLSITMASIETYKMHLTVKPFHNTD
jgi:hypothetical protein